MSNDRTDLNWNVGSKLPTFQSPQFLDIYDIRTASRNVQLTVTTLVGLINRPQPRVYLLTSDDDLFWLQQALHTIPHKLSSAEGDAVLNTLLLQYRVEGLIIYDPAFIDTINIATMIAGQRNGIVVAAEQVQALQEAHDLLILTDLRTYSWSNRAQIYAWALQHLRPSASPHMVAGLNPQVITGLRSFLVATQTFIYWLNPHRSLTGRSKERALFQQILRSYAPGSTHLGWFLDESSGVRMTSEAAITVLASDHFCNLEVWAATQTSDRSSFPPRATRPPSLAPKIYLSFTISDGDNLQYNQHRMAHLWQDSARGSLPIGWTISPVLIQAAPAMAEFYLRTATPQDELVAGPSGAGYMFPSYWPAAHLAQFLHNTGQLMQAMNLTVLEVLDTNNWQSSGIPFAGYLSLTGMSFLNPSLQQIFARELSPFGVQGILSGAGRSSARWLLTDNIPIYHNLGLAHTVPGTIRMIKRAVTDQSRRPLFLNVYILAWTLRPSDLAQIALQLGPEYEIVLPGTLLAMLKQTF